MVEELGDQCNSNEVQLRTNKEQTEPQSKRAREEELDRDRVIHSPPSTSPRKKVRTFGKMLNSSARDRDEIDLSSEEDDEDTTYVSPCSTRTLQGYHSLLRREDRVRGRNAHSFLSRNCWSGLSEANNAWQYEHQ